MISEQQQQYKTYLKQQLKGSQAVSHLAKLLVERNTRLLRDICAYLTADQIQSISARALHNYSLGDRSRTKGGFFISQAKQLISHQDDMKYTDIFRKRKDIPIRQVVTKLTNGRFLQGQNAVQIEKQFQ